MFERPEVTGVFDKARMDDRDEDVLGDKLKYSVRLNLGGTFFGQLADDTVGDLAGVARINESLDDLRLITCADKAA